MVISATGEAEQVFRVGGMVLCGGQSQRMGRSKAWLPFGKELMLPRIARLLREVVQPIVVVAAPDQEVPPLPSEVQIVRDEEKGRGPLQGLLAGILALAGKVDAVYASSCDVPFLRPAFVRRMIGLLGENTTCVPHVDDYYHPLAAVYRVNIRDTIARLLHANRLRPVYLFDEVPTRIVEADELREVDPNLETLRNVNTPEQDEIAIRDWAATGKLVDT